MIRDDQPAATTEQPDGCQLSRRDFVKFGAFTGGSVAFLGATAGFPALVKAQAAAADAGAAYPLTDPANQIYSVCLQCNTGCGIKVKLLDGVIAKIDGNPYSPMTMYPHIPYDTPVSDAATIDGAICPKEIGRAHV